MIACTKERVLHSYQCSKWFYCIRHTKERERTEEAVDMDGTYTLLQ